MTCGEAARVATRLLVKGVRVAGASTSVDATKGRALRLRVRPRFAKLFSGRPLRATIELSARDRAGNKRTMTKRVLVR